MLGFKVRKSWSLFWCFVSRIVKRCSENYIKDESWHLHHSTSWSCEKTVKTTQKMKVDICIIQHRDHVKRQWKLHKRWKLTFASFNFMIMWKDSENYTKDESWHLHHSTSWSCDKTLKTTQKMKVDICIIQLHDHVIRQWERHEWWKLTFASFNIMIMWQDSENYTTDESWHLHHSTTWSCDMAVRTTRMMKVDICIIQLHDHVIRQWERHEWWKLTFASFNIMIMWQDSENYTTDESWHLHHSTSWSCDKTVRTTRMMKVDICIIQHHDHVTRQWKLHKRWKLTFASFDIMIMWQDSENYTEDESWHLHHSTTLLNVSPPPLPFQESQQISQRKGSGGMSIIAPLVIL